MGAPDNMVFMGIPIGMTGGYFLEINPVPSDALPDMDRKFLLIGQKLSTGTDAVQSPVRVSNAEDAALRYGRGSSLHRMMMYVDKAKARYGTIDVWAMALDDNAAGTAATGTLVYTGSATEARAMPVWVGGNYMTVGVAYGDTAAQVATKVAAAINADVNLPVTATAATSTVTVTSRHKGEIGNGLELASIYYTDDRLPTGITAVATNLSGGTGNPTLSAAIAAIAGEPFYSIVVPYTDSANLTALEAEMTVRFGGMQMMTGHVFNAKDDTMSGLTTWGVTRNSPHSTTWGLKGCPTWHAERIAGFAAVCEASGAQHPAMPLRNLEIPGVLAPRIKDRFSRDEREMLLKDGISSTWSTRDNKVYLERVITNYQKNPQGIDDQSLLRLESKWQVDYYRYAHKVDVALRHPRAILVDDDANISPDLPHVKPKILAAEAYALDLKLEYAGIIEGVKANKDKYRFMRSMVDKDRVNAILPPNLANQFVTFAASVQFQL